MHVLVVNPWVTDFKLYDEWLHPLGLYFCISLLRQHGVKVSWINCLDARESPQQNGVAGITSTVIDKPALFGPLKRRYKRYGLTYSDFEIRVNGALRPDVVLVGSTMTYWIDGVVETVQQIRRILGNVPVIVGGIAAILTQDAMRKRLPDVTIFGQSLFTDQGRSLLDLLGVEFNAWKPSLSDCIGLVSFNHGPVCTSFGCPCRCAYCASSFLHPVPKLRDIKDVASEIRGLVDTNTVNDFAFYDDALLLEASEHLLPLLEAIGDLAGTIRFHLPNGIHAGLMTNQIACAMKQAGFTTVRFGYESGLDKFLDQTTQKASREQLSNALNIMLACGFTPDQLGVYIMGGLWEQKPQDMMEDLEFCNSLGVLVKPVWYSPVPHTPLFKRYATISPQILADPRSHNDTWFITSLPNWSENVVQEIILSSKRFNASVTH